MPSDSLPRYTTVAEAAETLAVTPDKITDLIHTGQLAAVDVSLHRGGKARWRIALTDLEAFLARRRTQSKPPAPRRKRKSGFERKYFV
jgi:DNA binding domain, excisionase family